jgi:NAD(P)-dependent dehydrogenase (short-subunit alcohol dehydrogenase family)
MPPARFHWSSAALFGAVTLAGVRLVNGSLRRGRFRFGGKTVLITGGARGLGLALARRFAAERATLVLVSRTEAELERARHELTARGASVFTVPADVRSPNAIDALIERTLALTGRIDVLVNNAGVIHVGPATHATIEDYQESLDTHFWAPLHLIRAAMPYLPRGAGRIVNISSIGGRIAVPHLLPYCVGKFALSALSDGLHSELAAEGISVLTVTPGLMRTGSHRNVKTRGRHRAEARWFALAGATSLTSMQVDRAAAQIVRAVRQRRARLTVGVQARTAHVLDTLVPGLSAAVMALAARALPASSTHPDAVQSVWSRDLDLGWITSLLPSGAAARMNQPVALDEI